MTRRAVLALVVAVCAAGCAGTAIGAAPDGGGPARLVDVTDEVGLAADHGAFRWGPSPDAAAMMGGGACWIDADGDGWMDLYTLATWSQDEHARWVADGGLPRSTLWHNEGGTFVDVGDEVGAGLAVRGQGCLAADLDGDGHTDLYVTTDRSNVLLWNDGDGTFVRDDGGAGLGGYGWTTSASAADVDGDGRLDLFVAGYADPNERREDAGAEGFPRSHQPVEDVLVRNLGPQGGSRAVFEVVTDAGLDPDGARYALGSTFADVDGDGDPDLVVANDTDPNRLYRNDSTVGRVRLVDVAVSAGADDDGSGMGLALADVDGDARDDLLVTNLGSQGHGLVARGPGDGVGFEDARARLGVPAFGDALTGWGVAVVDLDGDTHADVLVGNGAIPVLDVAADARPLRAWRAEGDGLVEASAAFGLDAVDDLNARAVAVGDADNDGDPDVLVTDIAGRARLLATVGGEGGWLVVAPEGAVPGTVVEVTLHDGRRLRREVRAGSSYLSTEDPRPLFGVGADPVAAVVVTWPDGATARRTDVAPGSVLGVARP